MNAQDRLGRATATFTGNGNMDKAPSRTCADLIDTKQLAEFEQGEDTYDGPNCWSTIDGAHTNLHSATIGTKQVAGNAMQCPRHPSQHKPVVFRFRTSPRACTKNIPAWISLHPDYRKEVIAECKETCGPNCSPFEKPCGLKTAVHKAAKYIRHKFRSALSETTEHKSSAAMSFYSSFLSRGTSHEPRSCRRFTTS